MSVTFYPAHKTNHPEWGEVIAQCEDATLDLNVANGNAIVILRVIGVDTEELIGSLSISQVREIADRLEEDPGNIRPGHEFRGENGCRVIEMGCSLDQLRRYAYWLRKLADEAEQIEAEFIAYD